MLARFIFAFFVICSGLAVSDALADTVINQSVAETGVIGLSSRSFQDDTGANSVTQAEVYFQNQQRQLQPSPILNFGSTGGDYWFDLRITNNSSFERWRIELLPAYPNMPSAIRTVAIYDSARPDKPLATWPKDGKSTGSKPSLPVSFPTIKTTQRYVLVQTWPGLHNPIMPILKTGEYTLNETTGQSQKIGLLWLIMGAVCGAGLVQMILTRKLLQGMLALNALVLAGAVFFLKRPDLVPGVSHYHPVVLPTFLYAFVGISASLMLWVAARPHTSRANFSALATIINILVPVAVVLKTDMLLQQTFTLEKLPLLLMSVTSLVLLLTTVVSGLAEISLLWFIPAWMALAIMPWLSGQHSFAAPVAYALLLALAGVSSVFSFWKSMDRETESLQNRLRQELKNIKNQYLQENKSWERKMESERVLLNELRHREQQRSAELEIARKEADAANQAKSDFLAIISHEIRSPMTGIMGVVDLMRHTPLNSEQHEYVDVIKNSGDTMVTLLNDILDYSKIEKGMIDLETIPFNLRVLVKSIATLMSGRAREKGLQIIIDIDNDLPEHYLGDPNRLRQILLNLVGNAVKFTPTGSVTIRITPSNKTDLRFEVVDTGIGISAEAQANLFRAYTQADASISRRFGGTGLGLNICRMLVTAMKGEIGLNSAEGQGSTFWFTLPLRVDDTSSQQPVETYNKPDKALRVLLIDDNIVNLKVAKGLLEMDGHAVITSENGQDALKQLEHEHVDVIFVDMLMPDMDGASFVRTLRQNTQSPSSKLPVFALTGLSSNDKAIDQEKIGLSGVLLKPVTRDVLRHALEQVIVNEAQGFETIISRIHTLSAEEQDKIRHALQPETVRTKSNTVLDTAMLHDLKTSLPTETLKELFGELIPKAQELMGAIMDAVKAGDMDDLSAQAHNLKGMAGNFGLQALMDHCAALEKYGRDNQPHQAGKIASQGPEILDETLSALDEWLKP